jgi:hypothetical protein
MWALPAAPPSAVAGPSWLPAIRSVQMRH